MKPARSPAASASAASASASATADTDGVAAPLIALFEAQHAALASILARIDTLAHSMIVTGAPGIGKGAFASALAGALLCEAGAATRNQGLACGHCDACRWFTAGTHPDARTLTLLIDDKGKVASEISIDQVRALESFARMSGYRSRRKVVIVDPAECLNQASSNALLKMLEEPGPGLHFILVTHRTDRLPATVRSRCRHIALPSPDFADSLAWLMHDPVRPAISEANARAALAFTGGAPLHARRLAEPPSMTACRSWVEAIAGLPDTSIVAAAETLASADIAMGQSLLQRWVSDLARVRFGAAPVFFPDSVARLKTLATRCVPMRLAQADAGLLRQAALTAHPLNARLFLEESCALYVDAFETARGQRHEQRSQYADRRKP